MIDRLNLLTAILERDPFFAEAMERVREEGGENRVDVLLVTATDVERDSLLVQFEQETGHKFKRRFGKRKTYYELGTLGGARIVMVQTEMGSVSPGAAFGTVAGACDELEPSAVITMGIAFGVDPKKQGIGDILVSRQLHPYELQRVGTRAKDKGLKLTSRGDVARASVRLIDRFRSAAVDWRKGAVRFGLILSGEKLIDNIDFRDQIRLMQPEAIGGEMEGAGTYGAAHERNKDWIVVKAICDWADGKKRVQKEKRQQNAADKAAAFVIHALRTGGFSLSSIRKS
jgi:nucleoside phosphorylase